MKSILRITIALSLLFFIPQQSNAQFLKKMAKHAEEKVKREAENRTENRVDKKIDEGFNKIEDALDGKKNKKDKSKDKQNENEEVEKQDSENSNIDKEEQGKETEEQAKPKEPNVVWSKFDFVPGDVVLFEDAPSTDEENGEFPSRWDLHEGGAEVAEFNGTPVIMFLDDGGAIIPYLKNSNEDYLPEVFTIEMDVWFGEEQEYKRYWIEFYDKKNQRRKENTAIVLYPNGLEYGNSNKRYPGRENVNWGEVDEPQWRHISIAYTKGKFKAYMDDTRLINIPHLEGNPTGITIRSEHGSTTYIKNIRIAKGGVKYYDRVLSEGKIIVNGIKFDVNKATLKPESMGPINKIYKLMQKQADLNFSIEGHTDSDGSDDANLELSKARGKAVMDKLISMGIAPNRLRSTGFGESKPLDSNSSAEGKANNRRVEFVKF